jgi:TolB-like protein/Tfp pilus assembly protein PilF
VIYEMLTGRQPFAGDYEQAVMYSIMNEEQEPVTGLRTGIPMELERMVNKAMAKNPDERYQHVDELLTDMQKLKKNLESGKTLTPAPSSLVTQEPARKTEWRKAIPIGGIALIILILAWQWILKREDRLDVTPKGKSIAVLPFTTITKAEEDEIFNEGMHDDIITQLAKIRDLKVIARTSVIQYKNTEKRVSEIGKELGVSSILEGSVRRAGNQIRVVAKLIDAQTEENLWAESYDRDYSDIFSLQSNVAQKIAFALRATLTPEEQESIERKPTENMQAYDYFQKGNHYWNNYDTFEGNEKAAQMFEKAVDLDSAFALAYTKLVVVHSVLLLWDPSGARRQKAKIALEKAVLLAPGLPEVHHAKGYYLEDVEYDFDRALEEYKIALQGRPNSSEIILSIGTLFVRQGRMQEAAEYFKKSYSIDPHQINSGLWVCTAYVFQRSWSEAEHWANIYVANRPEHVFGYRRKAQIYAFGNGDLKGAKSIVYEGEEHSKTHQRYLSEAKWVLELFSRNYRGALVVSTPDSAETYLRKGLAYHLMDDRSRAKAHFDSSAAIYEKRVEKQPDNLDWHLSLGLAYAGLGKISAALREGEQAVEIHKATLPIVSVISFYTSAPLNLAHINILIGDHDEAIEQLETLLSIPSELTLWRLKLDPLYDPLRTHPRFQKLLEKGT